LTWSANAGEAAVAACISPVGNPLHESRMYAMAHVAIHDALNAIDRRSLPYVFDGAAGPLASPDAAVAAAARDVLVTLIGQLPAPQTCKDAAVLSVETDYAAALSDIPELAKMQGVEVGAAAATAILALRSDDGSDTLLQDFAYPQGTEPGEYRFTPGFDPPFAFAPGWGDVTPFVLRSSSQFHVRPPYAVTGKKYTRDFNEVKRLGGDGTSTSPSERTADQTEIARFWVESSPLAWNRIARTVSADQGLDMWENARLFGLLNMALADGYVGTFETKYELNFWRPVTAIRAAATDGNPNTDVNANWTPLVTTPPIPEHDSGHSVEGGAAAQVLRRFFGTDAISFENCSMTLPVGSRCTDVLPVSRSYTSFTQAAEENGFSRILVGFHFRNAVEQGVKHGTRIGDRAFLLFMRPVG
jgi:vanadium-dependent haloperoxidase-like protein